MPHCELNHNNAFELTVAVLLLSAQCTDETVNKGDLSCSKVRSPTGLSQRSLEELEQHGDIRRIGACRNKAKHIQEHIAVF